MRAESITLAAEIRRALETIRSRLDWSTLEERRERLAAQAEEPDLWENPERASTVLRARQRLERSVEACLKLEQELADLEALAVLGAEESESEVEEEARAGLESLLEYARLRAREALLSGETDGNDAYLEINAGAGGTDACDWAEMLARMYRRWAESRGYEVESISESPGEEAGLRSVTLQISGADAHGWLKTETGVHRLVRISPFDSQKRRHTAFASVWAVPVVDDSINIEILDKDLRIDTFRASGAGGQHVNKTDSAVRITHLPTGIVATSSERSQHQNRAQAMQILRARLYDHEFRLREEERLKTEAGKTDIGWGHQIRSYVLQPRQMVKDLRTGLARSDVDAVLDGALDPFMSAELARRAGVEAAQDGQDGMDL